MQILLDTTRLNGTQVFANPIGGIGGTIAKELIDHRHIKVIADGGTNSACGGTKDVQNAIDETFVHPLGDEDFGEPDQWFDEEEIIDFVEIIFVLEHRNLQFILFSRIDIAIHKPAEEQTAKRHEE